MSYEGLNSFIEGTGIIAGSQVNGYCREGYVVDSPDNLVVTGRCNINGEYDDVYSECFGQ